MNKFNNKRGNSVMNKTCSILSRIGIVISVTLFLPWQTYAAPDTNQDIRQFYENSKSGKIIDFVGDSTTESAPAMYDRISQLYNIPGGPLEGAAINNRGSNGNTLYNFVRNTAANGNTINTVIQDNADLYIISYGINDIRRGGEFTGSSPDQIKADLKTAIDRILKETKGYILLRTPNTFLNRNPAASKLLSPIENAQLYSDQLWEAYESFKGYNERVDIIDIPGLVFGRKAMPEHVLMQDILHPNAAGYRAIADVIVERITGGKAAREWHYTSYDPKTFTLELRQAVQVFEDWQPYNHRPISTIAPQILTVVKQKSDDETAADGWYQVETWLGQKWIHAVRPVARYTDWVHNIRHAGDKTTTVNITNQTFLYDDAYIDTSTGYSIVPQTVEVIDVGNYMYKIKTWYGDKWIPASATSSPLDNRKGKLANSNESKIIPIDQLITLTLNTALSQLPTAEAVRRLGALSPQTVRAFEKKGDWYHIHTTWTGDAWLYYSDIEQNT
jgi:lysophospholipase L1-like esterase